MRKNKVLIVEDDISLCTLLENMLKSTYDVTALHNSMEAWQWLSAGNYPQLIITDFKMPLVDGLELVENIKSSGIFKDIPIFIISGKNDPGLREKCDQYGVKAFITKPFSPTDLIKSMKETLN